MNKTARGLTAAICLKEERGMKRPSPHRWLRWVGVLLLGGVLAVGAGGVARAQSPGVGKVFRDCAACPEMVVVPAGSYRMGSPRGERGRDKDEGPQHRVTIAEPFAVGVYEVTREEFGRFVNATGYSSGNRCWTYENGKGKERSGRDWRNPGFSQTGRHPVACVSYEDAYTYVQWLGQKTGQDYRFLSEAEWEYVARAGTMTPYHTGVTISPSQANYNENNNGTVPVGSYAPNAFGLYDVHGNVWEWVADCSNDSYRGAPSDGSAWESGDCTRAVVRGGSWYDLPELLRSAFRLSFVSGYRSFDFSGFRVARTLTP